jgi:hypothetical protein
MDDVEAVIFDVFGTVVDWKSSVTDQLVEFGRKHGLSGILVYVIGLLVTCCGQTLRKTGKPWLLYGDSNTLSIRMRLLPPATNGLTACSARIAGGGEGPLNIDVLHRQILEEFLFSDTRWWHLNDVLDEEGKERLNLIWHKLSGNRFSLRVQVPSLKDCRLAGCKPRTV